MSNNYHTPVIGTDLVDAANTNAPYGELDQVITDMLTGIEAFAALQLGTLGTVTETYDSANVDADVNLKQITLSTYGSDVATGGTASASAASLPAANAFDNNNSTVWFTGASAQPIWLKYDRGAGNEVTARRYTVRAHASDPTLAPKSWAFEGSNDNTNWTVLDTQTDVSAFSAGEQRAYTFYNAVAYRYYRISVTKNQSNTTTQATIAELEFMEAATFTDAKDKLEQGFEVSDNCTVNTVQLRLKKTGSPTGDLTLEIQPDSTGDPSGTPVTNGTSTVIVASTVTGSYTWVTFTYSTPPSIDAGTPYHLVLKTTDVDSEINYIQWGADSSAPGYANGVMQSEQSAVWVAESKDAAFILSGTQVANGTCLIEMHSTTQGVLPPRMTTAQRDLIAAPSNGMLLYNTTTDLLNVYADSWTALNAAADNNALIEITPQTTFAGQSSVSIAIPAGYKDILLRVSAVGDSGAETMKLRLNNDSGANYRHTLGYYLAAATPATGQTSVALDMYSDVSDDSMYHYEIWLYDYLTITNHRMGSVEAQYSSADAALAIGANNWMGVFFWDNTAAAISSVELSRTALITGSYALYGLL